MEPSNVPLPLVLFTFLLFRIDAFLHNLLNSKWRDLLSGFAVIGLGVVTARLREAAVMFYMQHRRVWGAVEDNRGYRTPGTTLQPITGQQFVDVVLSTGYTYLKP